jgi:hypothetical protein
MRLRSASTAAASPATPASSTASTNEAAADGAGDLRAVGPVSLAQLPALYADLAKLRLGALVVLTTMVRIAATVIVVCDSWRLTCLVMRRE